MAEPSDADIIADIKQVTPPCSVYAKANSAGTSTSTMGDGSHITRFTMVGAVGHLFVLQRDS